MSAPPDDPVRWRDDGGDTHALRARAAALADAARDVPALEPEAKARIRGEIAARARGRSFGSLFDALSSASWGLRFAVIAGIVLASMATAKGTAILWRRYVAPGPKVESPVEKAPRTRAPARQASPSAALSAPAPVEEVGPPPEAAPAAEPVRRAPTAPRPTKLALAEPTRAPLPIDVTPPPEPAPALATAAPETEARLVARAFSQLRQAGDPRGALALLDRYAQAFPHGVLEPEAMQARLEAFLALDDRAAALALIDGRRSFSGRLGADLRLVRAELRAGAGRYAEARRDFDEVLGRGAPPLPPDAAERALYGRAVCLGHLHEDERARADLRAYLERFPAGNHAVEATRLLAGAPQKGP